MKNPILLLAALFSLLEMNAQECVNPNQIDLDVFCITLFEPVCGCDGVTYGNECEAFNWGGVISWTEGPCEKTPGCMDLFEADFGPCDFVLGYGWFNGECVTISGCSTVDQNSMEDLADFIYDDPISCQLACDPDGCIDLAGADFGDCLAIVGYGVLNGECAAISGCGSTDINSGLDLGEYIFDDEESCAQACSSGGCIDPSLIDPEVLCPDIEDPVCGCDSVTYFNSCVAEYWFGVSSWSLGACNTSEQCMNLDDADFGDCEAIIGVGLINGECSAISGCGTYDFNSETDLADFIFDDLESCQASCNQFCLDVGEVDFGPCDAELGYAISNGSCQLLSGCGFFVEGVDYSQAFFEDESSCAEACTNSVVEPKELSPELYPVPFNDVLNVQFDRPVLADWSLLDLSGREIQNGRFNNVQRTIVNGKQLPTGVYFLRITAGEQLFTRKVIRE